jgi:ATP-dependent Clp protease adaptor protein ClpS
MATVTETKSSTNTTFKLPHKYNVIYVNDDYTTFEFVISSLQEVFRFPYEKAENFAKQVNDAGSAVVATMTFELAEQKATEVMKSARAEGFPLLVRIERAA